MTQGINGYSHSNYEQWERMQEPETPLNKAARDYCTHADGVISGALCDERVVISNACRTSHDEPDVTLCDDKKLAQAQQTVWETMKDAFKMIFGGIVGKAAK